MMTQPQHPQLLHVAFCWQVLYLRAEEHFSEKRYKECIQELDITRIGDLMACPGIVKESEHFLDNSMQRLLQHACFLAGCTELAHESTANLKMQLQSFLAVFLQPEERGTAKAHIGETTNKALEAADAACIDVFDSFDTLQQQSDDETTEQHRVQSAPSMCGGRATHEVPLPPLRENLLHLHTWSNFENESLDKVKTALAFVQSEDPLLDRCSLCNHWIALVGTAKEWLSEQELLHRCVNCLDSNIRILDTNVQIMKGIVSVLRAARKDNQSIADLGTKFDQWWFNSRQNGHLVTHVIELQDEIGTCQRKTFNAPSLSLASKVKVAKEMINEILTLVFTASSQLWWLTIQLVKQSVSDTATTETKPRASELAKLEVFDQHMHRWSEMVEVMHTLPTCRKIQMHQTMINVIQAANAQQTWVAFGTAFLHVACDPHAGHATKDSIAHLIALAVAAVPVTSNTDGGDLIEQAQYIQYGADLQQEKNNLMKQVVCHLAWAHH